MIDVRRVRDWSGKGMGRVGSGSCVWEGEWGLGYKGGWGLC